MAFLCNICGKSYTRKASLDRHIRTVHEQRRERCPFCDKTFTSLQNLQAHTRQCNSRPNGDCTTPPGFPFDLVNPPEGATDLLQRNWNAIRTRIVYLGKAVNAFNFRLLSDSEIGIHQSVDFEAIFRHQSAAFKLTFAFGYVLRNRITGETRYFHPSSNDSIFPEPVLVRNRDDFIQFQQDFRNTDFHTLVLNLRPDSKWYVDQITNIAFYLFLIANRPIGGGVVKLPDFLKNNRGVYGLLRNGMTGALYQDKLCFFRALALFRGSPITSLVNASNRLFYLSQAGSPKEFPGVTLRDLPSLEKTYRINIAVYELKKNSGGKVFASLVQQSLRAAFFPHDPCMRLNLYKNHFSLISNYELYTKLTECPRCKKTWSNRRDMERHSKTCTGKVKVCFPGGIMHNKQTIFEELEDWDISTPTSLRFYPFRATFDIETYMVRDDVTERKATEKTIFLGKHELLSISACSNIENYTSPKCFITSGDSYKLVCEAMDYLVTVQQKAFETLSKRYAPILASIDAELERQLLLEPNVKGKHPLCLLKEKLLAYLARLPLLSFNGGRYDLNVLKPWFAVYFYSHGIKPHIIKKGNDYISISTCRFHFLDIKNYLAPNYSYQAYLKAYKCEESKGVFPYDYITSLQTLDETCLPPKTAFFNKLKNTAISDQEYQLCQNVWKAEKMETLRDFLVWYNNADVAPFLEALDKQSAIYRERGVDMFKQALTVPGLSQIILLKNMSPDCFITLFDKTEVENFQLIRSQIVGGPAICFHRYHRAGETLLRPEQGVSGELCRKIIGYDANSLYLHCLGQDLPCGPCTTLKPNADGVFKASRAKRWYFGDMADKWLKWFAFSNGVHVRHQRNATEKQVGSKRLRVDGFCKERKLILSFLGCRFHGHLFCRLNKRNSGHPFTGRTAVELAQDTKAVHDYYRSLNYRVIVMRECKWLRLQNTPAIASFLQNFATRKRWPNTQEKIIAEIRQDKIFGMACCDLHVPPPLREQFSEMTPIFKNIEVGVEHVGGLMGDFARKHNLLNRPRRTLIGSYRGDKILLATPLLKWYLERGLEITAVHSVMCYEKKPPFQNFVKLVTASRRQGDAHESLKIIGDTDKLIGNSAYGKMATKVENHRNVTITDEGGVHRMIEDHRFRSLLEITPDIFEVVSMPRKLKMNLAIHVAFFVYQYAKLRMLEFYHDFLDVYVDRIHYQVCYTDTDSLYIALAADDLDSLVKPEKRRAFFTERHRWLPSPACEEHMNAFVETRCRGEAWLQTFECCKAREAFDKREPGLFKMEFSGDSFVSLNSKTYYSSGEKEDKLSCKGVIKKQNHLTEQTYLNVLNTGLSVPCKNTSFRVHNNAVYTYTQERSALTYLYIKRRVLDDGVSTEPLEI